MMEPVQACLFLVGLCCAGSFIVDKTGQLAFADEARQNKRVLLSLRPVSLKFH